jgi:DNA-binding beta-propeller fold protein YncE
MHTLARTDRNPNTIALSPDGELLFVSCRGRNGPGGYLTVADEGGTVLVLDARTGARLATLPAGKQPTALAVSADGRRLVFSDFRDNQLEVYDLPPTADLRREAAGGAPRPTGASAADAGPPPVPCPH